MEASHGREGCLLVGPPPVTLHVDERGHILRGLFTGHSVHEIERQIVTGHRSASRQVAVRRGFARPWWRLWKATRVVILTVHPQAFGPDLDDGTHW